MLNLKEIFDSLPLPLKKSNQSFSAKPIIGFEKHRIAKNNSENPCLLIYVDKSNSTFSIQNQELYNLTITHNLECEIVLESKTTIEKFSVIKYTGQSSDLKDFFLKSIEILIQSLGKNPSNQKIKSVVENFIELFRSLNQPPRNTVQGLWAELFLISQSKNPYLFIEGWHNIPEEKFDFSFGKLRMEVKSSSKRSRVHNFSFEQLNEIRGIKIIVVSIFVESLAGGKNIQDLVQIIKHKLKSHPKAIEKLDLLVLATLGSSINKIEHNSFDFQLAKESLAFYHAIDIPKIESSSIPRMVRSVKFISDLTNSPFIKKSCDEIISSFSTPNS